MKDVQSAARALGVHLHVLHASADRDFDVIFATLIQLRADGLVIAADPLFAGRSEQLAALAARHAVPAISGRRDFAVAGGLLSYGADIGESYRLAGIYTGRVLKGDKPANLPVSRGGWLLTGDGLPLDKLHERVTRRATSSPRVILW